MEIIRNKRMGPFNLNIWGSVEEPLFLAVDVAKAIDYSIGNTMHMLEAIDYNEKLLIRLSSTRTNITTARGNATDKWFLTEYGLYEVLMQSRKPKAKVFKQFVKTTLKELRLSKPDKLEMFEECFYGDPFVVEWENFISQNEEYEDMDYHTWLIEFKGYTERMLDLNRD